MVIGVPGGLAGVVIAGIPDAGPGAVKTGRACGAATTTPP
jgi:hypothetical protein